MFDYLRLDVVERKIDVTRLLAFPFYSVGFGVPLFHRNGIPATELCLCPVDCHSSMMGTIPFFSLLLFTKNSTLNVALILVCFLVAKLVSHALNG